MKKLGLLLNNYMNTSSNYSFSLLLQYLLFFLALEKLNMEDDEVLKDELIDRLQFWMDGHSRTLLIKPGTRVTSSAVSQHKPLSNTSVSSFWEK